MKLGVVLEPPERRPGENEVTRACPPQSLQLGPCRGVIGGWSPIAPALFEKGDDPAPGKCAPRSPLVIVHQDETAAFRDEAEDFCCRQPHLLRPVGLRRGRARAAKG